MCGIVGYVGNGSAREIIIDGLKKLEYRGYDSSGIAFDAGRKNRNKKMSGENKQSRSYTFQGNNRRAHRDRTHEMGYARSAVRCECASAC